MTDASADGLVTATLPWYRFIVRRPGHGYTESVCLVCGGSDYTPGPMHNPDCPVAAAEKEAERAMDDFLSTSVDRRYELRPHEGRIMININEAVRKLFGDRSER